MSTPAVELDRVSKAFRPPPAPWRRLLRRPPRPDVVALRDVSLRVEPGEILGLVGPNGAGKTVLVKLVATLTEPTAGGVRVLGFDTVRQGHEVRARVGLTTTDERCFYWRLTARQNLDFFARLHGHDRAATRRKFGELADLLELDAILDRPYSTLSAGNRQRLAIARALLADPPLLLLDEPTSSLDPIAAAGLRRLVADRIRTGAGRCVVFTTHDMLEVEELCSRVAILHRGRLLECDDLPSLRARHRLGERVSVRFAPPGDAAALDALRRRTPELQWDNGAAAAVHFERQADDDRLHHLIGELMAAGARIVACRTEVRDLRSLFERVVSESDAGGEP